MGLLQLSGSWSDNGRHWPCSRTPSCWGSPCSICIRTPGPPIQWMTLHQKPLSGLSPLHFSYGPPMLACPYCPCPPNRTTTMPGRHPRHASCFSQLPQPPSPSSPLELNFIWALAFFSALQRQVNYFSTPSVAPDMTSSSIRFDMLKKLAMTFRRV